MQLDKTIERLSLEFKDNKYFGFYGPTNELNIVEQIQNELDVVLPNDIIHFIKQYGSIQFSPIYLNFVPNEFLEGCIDWTKRLREKNPEVSGDLLVIMEDESVQYLLNCSNGKIYSWESYRPPIVQNFYKEFNNIEDFILYLAEMAR